MQYKVRYRLDCVLKKRRPDGINALNMELVGSLPFVPFPGMMIIPAPGDDFRKVDDVYYDSPAKEIIVFFEDSTWAPQDMVAVGWREED